MTDEEKETLTRMNNFFCGLHFVVGLADSAEEVMKVWEAQHLDDYQHMSASTSSTQTLIRTACKAFHHQGSQQCGTSALFRAYMRKNGMHRLPLAKFVGNRFNIIFYDAAGIFYLQEHMIQFVVSVHGKSANLLLQAVVSGLKKPFNIIGCRALGLVDKIVTGPLWRKLVECPSSILQMSSVYTRIKTKFDVWSDSSCDILLGNDFLEDCPEIHKDDVWNSLIEPNENLDTITIELLQLLFGAFSNTTQRLLVDHLPGGIYNSVTESTLIEEISCVPTNNIAPERDFAILDRMIREKPNASTLALEAFIMYSHNKTSSWLQKKTCEELLEY